MSNDETYDTTSTPEPAPPPPPPSASTQPASAIGPKNPWVAAVLSLFPGMGNVYNGLYLRAVTFFALVALCIYLAGHGSELWGFAVAFVWIFNVVDAYRQALLINHGFADDPGVARRLRGKAATREKLFFGTALLILGGLELLDRWIGPIRLDWIFELWPLVFIAIGGWLIFRAVQSRRMTPRGDESPEEPAADPPE